MNGILISLFGSVFLMFTWWAAEKNKSDKKRGRVNWKGWFYDHIDEAGYAFFSALIIGIFMDEFIYFVGVISDKYQDVPIIGAFTSDEINEFYINGEKLIYFFGGVFGASIIKGIIELKSRFSK